MSTTQAPAQQVPATPLQFPVIEDMYTRAATRLERCKIHTAKLLALEMNEENDAALQKFIGNCNTAVSEIQSERMVYTKKFDEIKSKFTSVENGIKAEQQTAQKRRDEYATKKAMEKKKAEAEAQAKIARDHELIELRRECEMQLATFVGNLKQTLSNLFAKGFKAVTAENYDEKVAKIKAYPETLPKEYSDFKFVSHSRYGHELEPIANEVRDRNSLKYATDWAIFIHELRTGALMHLQNRKAAGFAVSVAQDGTTSQPAIVLDVDTTVDTKQIDIAANVAKTMATFEAAPAIDESKQPRESVKITITDKLGYQAIAAFWFSTFLGSVDFDGLEKKTLKSMVLDVEKHAKNTNEQIDSEFIQYDVVYKASNSKK